MKCISSVIYSFLIDGNPSDIITPPRGIRQGEPLYSYIYLLCTEGLSHLITQAEERGQITGFQVSRSGPSITHMLFADDYLLFCKATAQECHVLLTILQQYQEVSG